MKNVLIKNHILNQKLISQDVDGLTFLYYFTTSLCDDPVMYSKGVFTYNKGATIANIGFNRKKAKRLLSFFYKDVRFNMITCPPGKVEFAVETIKEKLGGDNKPFNEKQETPFEIEVDEPFMLGETEVTQELFETVMEFNHSEVDPLKRYKNKPVTNVTWYDCAEFCNRLSDHFGVDRCYKIYNKAFHCAGDNEQKGKPVYLGSIQRADFEIIQGSNGFRLPKEWEWQLAARAGTNNKYPGSASEKLLPSVAWYRSGENPSPRIQPITQKKPNEWGFYDMGGNVWERCENKYFPDEAVILTIPPDIVLFTKNIHKNHTTARGGSVYGSSSTIESKFRSFHDLSARSSGLGFRIAKNI